MGMDTEDTGREVSFMPGFNGTGPMGAGPMTGGGRGYCNPYGRSYGGRSFGGGRGFGRGFGAGYGRGRGYGRGFGWRSAYPAQDIWYGEPSYGAPYRMNPDEEVNMLKGEAQAMKNELDAINRRIETLESESSED